MDDQFIKDRLQNIEHFTRVNSAHLETILKTALTEAQRLQQQTEFNPLNRSALKCFSQSDEDGITLEILRRIQPQNRTFLEFGCGDGVENNTLVLAAQGWRGTWVGGQDVVWNLTVAKDRLLFLKRWVDLEKLPYIVKEAMDWTGSPEVVSMDLDGNDFHFVRALLTAGIKPSLFIVEYNAKFSYDIEFAIPYSADFNWDGTDYFGCSLATYNRLFNQNDYTLVACNRQTGANAFFVHNQYIDKFADCPRALRDLYSPPRYHTLVKTDHPISLRTIEALFSQPK